MSGLESLSTATRVSSFRSKSYAAPLYISSSYKIIKTVRGSSQDSYIHIMFIPNLISTYLVLFMSPLRYVVSMYHPTWWFIQNFFLRVLLYPDLPQSCYCNHSNDCFTRLFSSFTTTMCQEQQKIYYLKKKVHSIPFRFIVTISVGKYPQNKFVPVPSLASFFFSLSLSVHLEGNKTTLGENAVVLNVLKSFS